MDKTAPGGVYLCQVNENVSCGACCGLYNIPDLSREKLSGALSWPFRPSSVTPANYFFKDRLYGRKAVDYAGINPELVSLRYDAIFREFGSCFKSDEEVRKAEMIIESLWERLQKGADNYGYC